MRLLLPQHIAFKCIMADAATEMLLNNRRYFLNCIYRLKNVFSFG